MPDNRFIHLAQHGGCSRKLGGNQLNNLLTSLSVPWRSENNKDHWEDAGIFYYQSDLIFVGNVDIVLPMVNEPTDFGEIVVAHVLSDLYAVGAQPLYGLNILTAPMTMPGVAAQIHTMLDGATNKLMEAGAILTGGHSLGGDELQYGLAVFGLTTPQKLVRSSGAQPGDLLILTKPLGTSIASWHWRQSEEYHQEFQDVLHGMKQLNDVASLAMVNLPVHACTDITGYGFLGHLHNLLRASQVAATIEFKQLPIYPSVKKHVDEHAFTRMFSKNRDYLRHFVQREVRGLQISDLLVLYDAQVSGGLLVSLAPDLATTYLERLKLKGIEGFIVGSVTSGEPGHITIV